jgi:hypothetical protein
MYAFDIAGQLVLLYLAYMLFGGCVCSVVAKSSGDVPGSIKNDGGIARILPVKTRRGDKYGDAGNYMSTGVVDRSGDSA